MKNTLFSAFFILLLVLLVIFSGCQRRQQVIVDVQTSSPEVCSDEPRVLTFGFYAYFAPVSYSADSNPVSEVFNTHQGYEADLLTALEAMDDVGVSFLRKAIV